MENVIPATPPKLKSPGRWWFGMGVAVFILGLFAYALQFSLKVLEVPWYTPVLGVVGLVMVVVSCWRKPAVPRLLGLGVMLAFFAGEWYFLMALSRLPAYAGPAKPGQSLPAFTTTRADGTPFTEKDLQEGKPTVLLFFRGRW